MESIASSRGGRALAQRIEQAAEQSLGRVHDAYAGVIGLGLDLGAHGSTDDDWMTSDENDNSSVRNVKGDLSSRRGPVKGGVPLVWWRQRPAQPIEFVSDYSRNTAPPNLSHQSIETAPRETEKLSQDLGPTRKSVPNSGVKVGAGICCLALPLICPV